MIKVYTYKVLFKRLITLTKEDAQKLIATMRQLKDTSKDFGHLAVCPDSNMIYNYIVFTE